MIMSRGGKTKMKFNLPRARVLLFSMGFCVCSSAAVNSGQPQPGSDWPAYGYNSDEQRFSPLGAINDKTVGRLGLAWSLELDQTARSLEATPLVVDGVMYFTVSLAKVYAVDATTGSVKWTYDPQPWLHQPEKMQYSQGQHRGVAYGEGMIYVGASDGRLIALDAKTGAQRWVADTVGPNGARKMITGAPRFFKGKVIIGHGGADFGTRGYVTAYDAKTGAQAWRFYIVPGNPANGFEDETQAMAAKTWGGEWWKWGGGGTAWNSIVFDEKLNRIYVGTGNSSNYNPQQRSPGGGDNLFLASIVALEADTGKYIWHYQVNPRDAWDQKATADIVLAELTIDGKPRKVLMQAPTNGFFYVIDRESGKLISAEKIGKVTWASRIDIATGRPVEAPNIRYETDEPFTIYPSPWGTHNWQAMAFSPATGLVYVTSDQLGATYWSTKEDREFAYEATVDKPQTRFPIGASLMISKPEEGDGISTLLAWDPIAQRPRWSVEYPRLWNGGTLATAGNLVFQGTAEGWLYGYNAQTGERVWSFNTKNGIIAPPITYSVKGRQYLAVLVGYGGSVAPVGTLMDAGWRYGKHKPRVLAFALDASAKLPPTPPPTYSVAPVDDPRIVIDAAAATQGENLWNHTCIGCHGVAAATAGPMAPDLRESRIATNFNAFSGVLDGALKERGMPPIPQFDAEQRKDLFMYIRSLARAEIERQANKASPK
jgi:quinohemoprotein ethanol dehydrogenase